MNIIESFRERIKGIDGHEFVETFKDICSGLERDHNILTFGFIIFDESNPEIRKVLRDKDYWEAIDKASGDRMMIFAAADEKQQKNEPDRVVMSFITSFNTTSNSKTKSYSLLMKKLFNNESLLVYPSVLFFQMQDGNISEYNLVPLKRGNEWNSMQEVQKLFSSISNVLEKILSENFGNRSEIFELIKNELRMQKYTMYILQGPKRISDFIGLVKNLLFL